MVREVNKSTNALRFVAAVLVVLGHLRNTLFQDYADVGHGLVPALVYLSASLGNSAVLVFFALSGYWVGGTALHQRLERRFSVQQYALARLTRLWLVLLPALVLTVVLDLVGSRAFSADIYVRPATYAGIEPHPSHSPLTLVGNVFFVQGLHVVPFGYNHPLWSLSYEFWYYVMFAALLVATAGRATGRTRVAGVVVAVVGAAIAGSEVLVLFAVWLAGVAAAWLAPAARRWAGRRTARRVAVVRGVAVIVLLLVMVAYRAGALGAGRGVLPELLGSGVFGVVAAFQLWTLAPDVAWVGIPGRLLDGASWLADSSYSLYATHMPLVALLGAALVPHKEDRWVLAGPGYLLLLVATVLLVAFAVAFSRVTERRTPAVLRWVRAQFAVADKRFATD